MSRQLIEAIRRIGGGYDADNVSIIFATVKSVNQDERTCVCIPINDKSAAEIPDVNISALPNDGELKFPQVDSVVIIARTAKNEPFILKESDLELYLLIANSIHLNGDEFGGLVKVQIASTALNTLQTEINTLKSTLIGNLTLMGTALAAVDGGVTSAQATVLSGVQLPQINISQIENTKVKHGNG